VLIVDDNSDAADSLSMVLDIIGAEARVARNDMEALAAYAAYEPSVVLLDIACRAPSPAEFTSETL